MKKVMLNIIKALIFIVLQYCMIMSPLALYSESFYYHYEILYCVISMLAFLLGEGGIFLICTAKSSKKKGVDDQSMKCLIFNIIKLLMSIVLQCHMLPWFFIFPFPFEWGYKNIISKVIILIGILLGEVGIYLLYTVKPLKNEKHNKIYTPIYIGINIIFFALIMYEYFTQNYVVDFIWNIFYGF